MALLEEVSPSPKVTRSPLSSGKGVRLVRAREIGVELGENTPVGTRRDMYTKVFQLQTSSLTRFRNQTERRDKAAAGLAPAPSRMATPRRSSVPRWPFSPPHDPIHLPNTIHHPNQRFDAAAGGRPAPFGMQSNAQPHGRGAQKIGCAGAHFHWAPLGITGHHWASLGITGGRWALRASLVWPYGGFFFFNFI